MKTTIFIIALMLSAHSAFTQNVNKLLGGYLNVKNALVNSDLKASTEAVTMLQQVIISEPAFAQKEDLQKATDKMAKAGSLEKQRTAFADVSAIFWKVIKPADALNQEIYYQYCPMKKAYWLSTEAAIKNPYYGASMLNCGKVAETKK